MINILHAIDTAGPGGAETVFVTLAKNLDPGKFRSFCAIPGPGWVCDELRKCDKEPVFVPSRGGFNLGYLISLIRIIRQKRIDLIHSHLLGSNLYCSLAGVVTHIPVISTFHGFVDSSEKSFSSWGKFAIVYRGSKKIVFVSHQLKSYYITEKNNSRTEVIYNGVDTNRFKPGRSHKIRNELGFTERNLIVGSVGNFRKAKGYDLLLRAAAHLKERRNDIKFVIAGQGSGPLYENLLRIRKNMKLEKTVFFLGFREDTIDLYHNFAIFILPSISEGFSISTIEAMACGVPVIVTRSGGPEEFISHNVNGLMCEPGDEFGLAEAINNLVMDAQLRERLAAAGTKTVFDRFRIGESIRQYEALYAEVCLSKLHAG